MDMVRQVVDGSVLGKLIPLPEAMLNVPVEVTVKPARAMEKPVDRQERPKITLSELRAMLPGSQTEALINAMQGCPYMTVDEIKEERLRKHECSD
jgi:hypothetical protein